MISFPLNTITAEFGAGSHTDTTKRGSNRCRTVTNNKNNVIFLDIPSA